MERLESPDESATEQVQMRAPVYALPLADGPQLRTGRVMSGIVAFPPAPGERVYLGRAPSQGSHFPEMSVTSLAEYAQMKAEAIRQALEMLASAEGLIIIPAGGGEWLDVIRASLFQAATDGYAALGAGVPVAIAEDALAIPESILDAKV